MENNKGVIPKYIFALIAIVLVCLIFLFVVQIPFLSEQPKLEKQHQADASQLQIYQNAYAGRESLTAEINSMKEKYESDSASLFVNANQSPSDIIKMLSQSKTEPTTYKISDPKADKKARKSSGGDTLYSTDISIVFDSLDDVEIETVLNYFESVSNGAYYVDDVNIKAIEKKQTVSDKENADDKKEESKKEESKSNSTKDVITSLYYTGKYEVSITLKLYYFISAENTPEALKKAIKETSQEASKKSSSSSKTSSSSSSASSAA